MKTKNLLEIMNKLLDEIQPIDIRDFLDLPDDTVLRQRHILVAVVGHLQELAVEKKWNLAKFYDYIYVYNSEYWQQLDKEDMKTFLGKAAIQMGFPYYEVRFYDFKDKLLKQFLSDAFFPVPSSQREKIFINLQNGTMEFTPTGQILREFNPADFITYQLPFVFDPKATCPMFDQYLAEVLPDENTRMVLQEFTGYIFSNLNLEKMLILLGTGANGKSVFFRIISAILGEQNILNYSLGHFGHEYNRAKLTNVLLNYSSEKGTELNPDTFKALVSGEPLQAREPYGKSFTLTNRVRFIVNANELPRETEQTEAYFRRYLIVPFNVTIPTERRDINLADNIITNELPGIFNWLLKGLERIMQQKKFTYNEQSEIALRDFKFQSDTVAQFLEEYSIESSNHEKTSLSKLYKKYKEFCFDNRYRLIGKNKFSLKLEQNGFEKVRMNNGSIAFLLHSTFSSYPQVA